MLMDFGGIPLFKYVYKRCQHIQGIDDIIIATSTDQSDDPLYRSARQEDLNVFRGALDNVLDRYISCGRKAGSDIIIRVCGDSPFVDIRVAEKLLLYLVKYELDYISVKKDKCVYGLDSEVVRLSTLKKIQDLTDQPDDLEHVTLFIRKNPHLFKTKWLEYKLDPFNGKVSLTVDTAKDFSYCNDVANTLAKKIGYSRFDFTTDDIFNSIRHHCNAE